MDAAIYSATDELRDGRKVEIRALRPEDRTDLLAAIGRAGKQSIFQRFFAFKRGFTEKEIDFYVNVDFVNHVALVALMEEEGRPVIVGGARYIVLEPGRAEIAFAVDDPHQALGLGSLLMRHLTAIARQAGLKELVAYVLPDNIAMLKIFERSGLKASIGREPDATQVSLWLA
jgi:RimJ/RimL family protein N-acetyltransferase